jgi:hypothetical protein
MLLGYFQIEGSDMATEPLAAYGIYEYDSDDGNTYDVKMMIPLASAGGFTASTPPYVGLPSGMEMRHILGKSSTNKAGILHVASNTATNWVTPTGWTGNSAVLYTATGGAIGEKRHAPL